MVNNSGPLLKENQIKVLKYHPADIYFFSSPVNKSPLGRPKPSTDSRPKIHENRIHEPHSLPKYTVYSGLCYIC